MLVIQESMKIELLFTCYSNNIKYKKKLFFEGNNKIKGQKKLFRNRTSALQHQIKFVKLGQYISKNE